MPTTEIAINLHDAKYLATIKNLRLRNFGKNLPFLILSPNLPESQVYREYPDGRMELQEVFTVGSKYQSKTISVLQSHEADRVREENGLF